jgi:hypothetical protein
VAVDRSVQFARGLRPRSSSIYIYTDLLNVGRSLIFASYLLEFKFDMLLLSTTYNGSDSM